MLKPHAKYLNSGSILNAYIHINTALYYVELSKLIKCQCLLVDNLDGLVVGLKIYSLSLNKFNFHPYIL